ncbi:MAG: thiamine pyrophosphate-binding protein [Nitrospinota bacterium]|jgi:thiamine pyrophosphate-dependent acetolactate synthase large subunit-like protein|nr:thiamine pyrophosphate-binding protein [Nitrospinota bacterium]
MGRQPQKNTDNSPMDWGSDAIAELLRRLDFRYVSLNPGASYRGLHDSIVNYLGNENPAMILALHEEHAVAIAHGYAKVTGKAMAVFLHTNVGLMHATLAIFNAWCDRVPIVIIGATGPLDAARRRPWIEWVHTTQDLGGLVRNFTKWDNQPGSVPAAFEAIVRAKLLASTAPCGPVYVCLDVALQEDELESEPEFPNLSRFPQPSLPAPSEATMEQAANLLVEARNPLILAGRVSRDSEAWDRRIALAEVMDAKVMTSLRQGAAFPTSHRLHACPSRTSLDDEGEALLCGADVIISLDWVDLAGTLKQVFKQSSVDAKIIHCSLDSYNHRGWSMDYQALPPLDLSILASPDELVSGLLERIGPARRGEFGSPVALESTSRPENLSDNGFRDDSLIDLRHLARCLGKLKGGRKVCITRLPSGWPGEECDFLDPLDFLGGDGGAGLGSGPGLAVGAALALKGSGRVPVAVLGDGDFLMGVTALWTAASLRLPLLIIVANNRSYNNDVVHQERVALQRGRPVENKWIGQRLDEPAPDLAGIAKAQGFEGEGPIEKFCDLEQAIERGLSAAEDGLCYLVDVLVHPI